jgi:hypothetical protein
MIIVRWRYDVILWYIGVGDFLILSWRLLLCAAANCWNTVPSIIIGTVKHLFLILALYYKSLDFKSNNDNEIKVLTESFNLRVFSSISVEPFRNYSTFCAKSIGEAKVLEQSSTNVSILSYIHSTQWLHQTCDYKLVGCICCLFWLWLWLWLWLCSPFYCK